MSQRIEPISMEDADRLEACVKQHRSVRILRVAEELGCLLLALQDPMGGSLQKIEPGGWAWKPIEREAWGKP